MEEESKDSEAASAIAPQPTSALPATKPAPTAADLFNKFSTHIQQRKQLEKAAQAAAAKSSAPAPAASSAGRITNQCDTCAAPIDDLSDSEDDRNHYLTPSHLTSCTDTIGVRFRERLRLQIINTLHPHPAAQPWLRQHQHASLSSILLSLCPTSAAASAANQPRHLTYVMCGVLTTTQVNAAVRTLGFTDPLDVTQGQRAVRALQLLCLDHVRQVYATRKDRILRAA